MSWEFGKEIKTKDDLRKAKAFLIHCMVEEYEDILKKEMDDLKEAIKLYEKGFDR